MDENLIIILIAIILFLILYLISIIMIFLEDLKYKKLIKQIFPLTNKNNNKNIHELKKIITWKREDYIHKRYNKLENGRVTDLLKIDDNIYFLSEIITKLKSNLPLTKKEIINLNQIFYNKI